MFGLEDSPTDNDLPKESDFLDGDFDDLEEDDIAQDWDDIADEIEEDEFLDDELDDELEEEDDLEETFFEDNPEFPDYMKN